MVDQMKVAKVVDEFMKLDDNEQATALHTMVIDPEVDLMELLRQLIVCGCPGCKEDDQG